MSKEFCYECHKDMEYSISKKIIKHEIGSKSYDIEVTTAICNNCYNEMNIKGLIDLNVKEIDEAYRKYEDLVSISDIKELINISNLNEKELSLKLGFDESDITNYLKGHYPSKECSDIIKNTLNDYNKK